jgi:hypothetical protein
VNKYYEKFKTFTFVLYFFTAAFSSGCSSSEPLNTSVKSDEVVLEVVTTGFGAAYPKEGDILNMRLFESGRFEFDDFPEHNPPHTRNAKVVRKESKLSLEAVKELIALTEQPDFLSANEKYPSWGNHHSDTFWDLSIKFICDEQQKKIEAADFWTMKDTEESKSVYPPSMLKLIERTEQLKAKAIGKSFKQWLLSPNS